MQLNVILDRLAGRPEVQQLGQLLRTQAGARAQVAPLIAAARAPVTAALARMAGPLLLVAGSSDAAQRVREDLCQWLGPEGVLLFPAADAMPYEHMSAAPQIIGQRLGVLRALSQAPAAPPDAQHPALIVVTPLKALLQATLTPGEFHEVSRVVQQGTQVDQEQQLRDWIELGYRSAPLVEEPGELARRGGIIDLWPPGSEQPVRIEWFGDEIDSLRFFDPLTQRSEARIAELYIGPPHEIPLWRRSQAISRLDALDLSSLRREARDEWNAAVTRLEQGLRFEGRAFFAPFFRQNRPASADEPEAPALESSLLAHLPPGAVVLLSDGRMLAQQALDLRRQADEHRLNLIEAGELPPQFPRPNLLWEELLLGLGSQRALVDLSTGETPDASQTIFPAFTARPVSLELAPDLFLAAELFGGQLRRLVDDIATRLESAEQVTVISPQAARIHELVTERLERGPAGEEPATLRRNEGKPARRSQPTDVAPAAGHALFEVLHGSLDGGFRSPQLGLILYSDNEIFGWRQRRLSSERRKRRERSAEERAAFLRGLKSGDYVVHIEHGIAVFEGMLTRSVGGVTREYLHLRYAEGDRLYVPVDQVDRVSRYIGSGDAAPQLTRLGTQDWERTKRKVRQAVQELAGELLQLYAARQLAPGYRFSPDSEWQRELEAAFPYIETPDQLKAINDVKHDMELSTPMDRLICGDVGFGKTEVALRAAFKAIQDGRQVAVLVPTTVLAQQHFETFRRRMSAFPVSVDMISRFRSNKEQDAIVERLALGEIDIIIGTHRLLSKDVRFKNLGLVVIDEEQRFGVRHKERLRQLRTEVDTLTLTATPIPRTLHMSLAGIRDLSVINTPPEDRLPIKTYVLPYEDNLVRDAIMRELDRGGQVFFLHNRVQTIYYVAERLRRLLPEARIGIGHGQLDERTLEQVMLDFFNNEYDVLVCTTIIENGLDVPNANTIIIDDATHYGLAQLYQLRGRVGRSSNRAYAYLLYPPDRPLTPEAQQRLEAIQEATELGAGFRIAMRDLEIRGAGNLLGAEQSGNIAAVGFDLYSRLLEQAVGQLKKQLPIRPAASADSSRAATTTGQPSTTPEPAATPTPTPRLHEKVLVSPLVTLDLPLTAYLPVDYIADDTVRLSVYQRLADAQTPRQVREMRQELRDRFGAPPEPAEHLLTWLLLKALALQGSVSSVISSEEEFIVRLPEVAGEERERLRRRFGRDTTVKIGPQFVRLDRRALRDDSWIEKLTAVLETLADR